jgi:hypothetical protein
MELDGNEKRIRALFSELSLQDRSHAPRFEKLWSGAERSGPAQIRYFRSSAIALGAAAIAAAFIFAAWLWSTPASSENHNAVNDAPRIITPAPGPDVFTPNNPPSSKEPKRPHRPRKKRVERITEPAMTEAEMLSNWRSPTNILLNSPTGFALNSLPQLNQSAEELKQFLPNDATKESNQ